MDVVAELREEESIRGTWGVGDEARRPRSTSHLFTGIIPVDPGGGRLSAEFQRNDEEATRREAARA